MTMKSNWNILYSGPHHGVFIKKFERFAGVKAILPKHERIVFNATKMVNGTFQLEHTATQWDDLVIEILALARTVHSGWAVVLGESSLCGRLSTNMHGDNARYPLPISGVQEISWEINKAQEYVDKRWLDDSRAQW